MHPGSDSSNSALVNVYFNNLLSSEVKSLDVTVFADFMVP